MSYTDSPTTTTFVIVFPKRRKSGLDNLENAIDDKVLAAEGNWGLSDNRIDVNLTAAEIAGRLANWVQPSPRYTRGVLAKYAKLVSTASEGAVTDKYL